MNFRALVVRKPDPEAKAVTARVENITPDMLPEGDVTVDVAYSCLNYKDGLCLTGNGGLVRNYPHVPGIDFAGKVVESANPEFVVGDRVVLTGWRVGEVHWGGYAEKARVKGEWLVKLPESLSERHAMAIGTAGLTAMLAVNALEAHGLTPAERPVVVTGASGGVGSVATTLLAKLGYPVAAVTGRPEHTEYLQKLGASEIIPRQELAETTKRPLESERFAAGIDTVGGALLARTLGQIAYGGSVAAVGLAGGANLPASVVPFLLRAINLLGIDSVMQPKAAREHAWARIDTLMPRDMLDQMTHEATLEQLPELGADILKGQVTGRVIVRTTA